MELICVAMLICVFHVKKSAECSNDDIVALAGFNVSLNWTLQPSSLKTDNLRIYNSLGNEIAEIAAGTCNVKDNSAYSCNIINATDRLAVSLTIFSVSSIQSGNYTIVTRIRDKGIGKSSVKLLVIGKPKIIEERKSVLGQPLEVTCNSKDGQECYIYRWIINRTGIISSHNVASHYFHSLNMTGNFSHATCQLCLNKTACNSASGICENDSCSIDSDPYTVYVMYGPNNITLSRKERDFYLKQHEIFTIDCSAYCYPGCIFWWKGHDIIESEQLNITFESGKAGQYTCYVMNLQTNMTLKSNSITLHHEEKGFREVVTALGLAAAVVLVAVIGSTLVIKWRKNASNKRDSRRPVVDLQIPVNGDMTSEISRIGIRPLPVPNKQETTCRRPYRLTYQNHARKSRSLHNLMDSSEVIFYPLVYSNTMGRNYKTGTHDYNLTWGSRISNCADSYEQEPEGDLYNTLNEVAFIESEVAAAIYDEPSNNITDKSSNEEQRNVRHEESNDDHANWHVI